MGSPRVRRREKLRRGHKSNTEVGDASQCEAWGAPELSPNLDKSIPRVCLVPSGTVHRGKMPLHSVME